MRAAFKLAIATNILLFFFGQVLLPYSKSISSTTNPITQEEFSEYFNQGENSRLQGDYEEAIELFTKALSHAQKNKDQTGAQKGNNGHPRGGIRGHPHQTNYARGYGNKEKAENSYAQCSYQSYVKGFHIAQYMRHQGDHQNYYKNPSKNIGQG